MDNCQVCYGARAGDRQEEKILADFLPVHRQSAALSLVQTNPNIYLAVIGGTILP